MAATSISFGEWLPDQPELGNAGLTIANNVVPAYGSYKPFQPLATLRAGSFTLPGAAVGGFVAELPYPTNPAYIYYGATTSQIYMANAAVGSGTFNSAATGLSTVGPQFETSFAQFDDKVFVARGSGGVLFHTAGSVTNLSTVTGLTGSRDGRYLAVIGRFLIVANLGSATSRPSTLEWSAVDDPTNFPTPLSATATATQSGEQVLNIADGPVVGVYGGDQYGVIVQTGAIVRMTYVGPPVVFQFDRVDAAKGQQRRHGSAQSGNLVFFQSADGFCKSDGVSIAAIGAGRVDRTFLTTAADDITNGAVTVGANVDCAFDHMNKAIVWSFPVGSVVNSNKLFIYSTEEDRWSSADQVLRILIEPSPSSKADGLYAFDANNVLCKFNGAPGTAVFTTGDIEMNPGGRSFIDGVKPHVEYSGTAPAVTVRVGTRDDLGASTSYSATTTPTTRTGFADFRKDGKYARAEVQVVGTFTKATGLEFHGIPSGEA